MSKQITKSSSLLSPGSYLLIVCIPLSYPLASSISTCIYSQLNNTADHPTSLAAKTRIILIPSQTVRIYIYFPAIVVRATYGVPTSTPLPCTPPQAQRPSLPKTYSGQPLTKAAELLVVLRSNRAYKSRLVFRKR